MKGRRMEILIIGGTRFVGRHLVDAALQHGHHVTLFNRGQTNPNLYPGLTHIQGDRDGDLERLAGGRWQAVIDTCGYFPRVVKAAAETLADSVDQYVFISSESVYEDFSNPGITETAPLARIDDPSIEEITWESYGALKALCEEEVRRVFPDGNQIIRPGLIVGPHDPTDRFTYWPWRVARGGEILVPEDPDWPVQIIDARDLAEWTIRMVEKQLCGTFNAVGPETPLTFGQVLEASQAISGAAVDWVWVSREFLLAQQVQPWSDLPVWAGEESRSGLMQVSNQAARDSGLRFRPLEETIQDTLTWVSGRPADEQLKAGLSLERERALLQAWKENNKTGEVK
jgi:2'-hydroxyisoflavone reductase